jgi:hypothetical protein
MAYITIKGDVGHNAYHLPHCMQDEHRASLQRHEPQNLLLPCPPNLLIVRHFEIKLWALDIAPVA